MKSRGFTVMEVLMALAILGTIAAVLVPNLLKPSSLDGNKPATNDTVLDDTAVFQQLSSEPVTSLNLTALKFMLNYCMWRTRQGYDADDKARWSLRATVYQNQIIILLLAERKD